MQRCFSAHRRSLLLSSLRLLSQSSSSSSSSSFPTTVVSPVISSTRILLGGFPSPFPYFQGLSGFQARHFADEAPSGKKTKSKYRRKARSRAFKKKKKKERSRAPMTPANSKVKKYKLKAPSSNKFRFRTLNDGTIRHWSAKGHHHSKKSKEALRRLRKPKDRSCSLCYSDEEAQLLRLVILKEYIGTSSNFDSVFVFILELLYYALQML